MQSVSCVLPVEIDSPADPRADTGRIASRLAQTQKHVGQFRCEIDARGAREWDNIAGEFEGECQPSAGSGQGCSDLLLWRHGRPVAGARVAIEKLSPLRRARAVVRCGPFWHRPGEDPDLTVYRAALGAIVQEYCIRRRHRLTIVPHPKARFRSDEIAALLHFGFLGDAAGRYSFCVPSSRRIMGGAMARAAHRMLARLLSPIDPASIRIS